MVGPRSNSWVSPSSFCPAGKRPGDQAITGVRVTASYIDHFWIRPWSPMQSP